MSSVQQPRTYLASLLPLVALACSGEGKPSDGPGDAGTVGSGGISAGAGGALGTPGCATGGSTAGDTPLRDCNLDGVCGACIAENTCDLFTFQCAPNVGCVCMAECVAGAGLGGVEACLGSCRLDGSPPGFAELAQVVATMCPDSDECSTPAGFVPPPTEEPTGSGSSVGLGGGTLPDCSFDPDLRYDPDAPVLQLRSADGDVCVRLERRSEGAGNSANTSFTLIDVRVGPLGEVCRASDPESVCWHSSHHNFDDWAHVVCGNRHYDVNIALSGHGAVPAYRLLAFEGGALGATCAPTADGLCPTGSPVELFPVP